jgi:hypothetical protein
VIARAVIAALPWGRIAAAASLLAAVGAGIAWHVHRVDLARAEGHVRGRAEVQVQWDAATILAQRLAARATADQRAIEQQRAADARMEVENAQHALDAARSDADRARLDVDRLRIAARSRGARCSGGAAGSDPTAAGGGASAAGAGDLLADVLGRLGDAGAAVAAEADRRGIAGAACERVYDALMVRP